MRRKFAFCLAISAIQPAYAAPIDMATLSCQDWIDASDDEQDQMVAWLRGYLAGRSTVTLYDPSGARIDHGTLSVACHRNPNIGVISAMSLATR